VLKFVIFGSVLKLTIFCAFVKVATTKPAQFSIRLMQVLQVKYVLIWMQQHDTCEFCALFTERKQIPAAKILVITEDCCRCQIWI